MEEEEKTSKSVQYVCTIEDIEYTVKALITSLPEEIEITNVEREENTDFVFSVNVITEPKLPREIFDDSKSLIYSIGYGSDNLLGYLVNGELIASDENLFSTTLEATVLEVLLIARNSGNFIAINNHGTGKNNSAV
jgi:hypothetical protein